MPSAPTPGEIEEIKEAFAKADKGGGGQITRQALGSVLRQVDSEPWSDEDLNDLFDLITSGGQFVPYDKFVNTVFNDEDAEVADDEDLDADEEDEDEHVGAMKSLPKVDLDLNTRLKKNEYVMLASRLGVDEDEAGSEYDEEERTLKEEGESVEGGVPLGEFLDDLKIETRDREGMQHLKNALLAVQADVSKGVSAPPSTAPESHAAMNIGLEKVLRRLGWEGRPHEDAYEVLQLEDLGVSRASKKLLEGLGKDALIAAVKEADLHPPALPATAGQAGNRELCIAKVNKIIEQCKASGKKFVDPEWDVINKPNEVLYVDRQKPGYDCTVGVPKAWKRLSDIYEAASGGGGGGGDLFSLAEASKKKGVVLYNKGVKAGDIVQGQIGTCFLLGALGAMVANNENAVKKAIIKYDVHAGVYGVRFNVDGEWTHVIVDDYMPVNQYGNLLYASSRDPGEVWTCILEKAYCKLHTCYEMCDGGRPNEAVFSFFGGACGRFPAGKKQKANPEKYFKALEQAYDRGWLLTTSFRPPAAGSTGGQGKCGEAVLPSGLVGGHVYSVLRIEEHHGNKLVQIRNPWGTGEWTGKWSDANREGEWTDQMKQAVNKVDKDDGKFWMCIEDFVQHTCGVDYTRAFGPPWKKLTQYKQFSDQGDLQATALWPYKAASPDELTINKGDIVEVEAISKGWWKGRTASSTKAGHFPANYVKLKDRAVPRFDLNGSAGTTAVVILMQENVCRKRKFFKRKADGLNYKDTKYPKMQLVVVAPDGKVVLKKQGCRREFSGELQLTGEGAYRIYAFAVDGVGGSFTVRTYFRDGTATLKEVESAQMSEVSSLIS